MAPYMPPSIDWVIEDEWSWYGHTPREPFTAVSRYVQLCPTATLAPGPEVPGMYAPSEPTAYLNAWKCIECLLRKRVSRFLKCTMTLSPTRARMVGPGMPSLSPVMYG